MNLADITPLILTYNEEANIERTLAALTWARTIIVVDSGSTDATPNLVLQFVNAELIRREFDNHAAQWNYGLEQIKSPWVLTLDADYVCSERLPAELRKLTPTHEAYAPDFRYCIYGRALRGTLYPARVALFRADRLRYRQDGHTQMLDVAVPVGRLSSVILHDDRKPLSRWLANQTEYAALEAVKLLITPTELLSWRDRLRRRIVWAPPLVFLHCLFGKGLLLDGWPGVYYALQRTYAELLLSLNLLDARLRGTRGRRSVADRGCDRVEVHPSASQTPPPREVIPAVEDRA